MGTSVMTFEDLYNPNVRYKVEIYWNISSKLVFSGYTSDIPEEILEKIKTRRVTGTTGSNDSVVYIRISETFEDLLDEYPELLEFNVEIYLGSVLAFANNLSKIPLEFLLNLKQRSVRRFDFTEDLQKAIITLEDYTKVEEHEYPLLKDVLKDLRNHHLGWTVIILTQDDDEYDRFTLTQNPSKYETDSELCDILSEQIDTEDNWDDVAEITICTNICY